MVGRPGENNKPPIIDDETKVMGIFFGGGCLGCGIVIFLFIVGFALAAKLAMAIFNR